MLLDDDSQSKIDTMLLDDSRQAVALYGPENAVVKSSKRKKDSSRVGDDDGQLNIAEKHYQRVLLSLGKPSYVLGLTSSRLRPENRKRLRTLLRKLVRLHDWKAASGVLSVLLRDPQKQSSPAMDRFKYGVFLNLVQHMEGDNLRAIDRIFDEWMAKIGINMSHRRKTCSLNEDRLAVRLESILFHFMKGDVEGERQNVRSLMQEHEFESHPMFNTMIGLFFYELWYSGIPEDMQLKHFNQMHHDIPSDMEADHSHSHLSASGLDCNAGLPEGSSAIFSEETRSLQCGSETSVMNGKAVVDGNSSGSHKENIHVEDGVKQFSKSYPEDFQPRGFYVNSADEASYDQVDDVNFMQGLPTLGNLDPWLRPIHSDNCELEKIIQTDEYNNAVTYLSRAVSSTPPVLAALLPLVQLLLIKYNWKEALKHLDNFCANSSASLPRRLKSCLMECVDPNNGDLLSSCYEDALKSDPTCRQSLARLMSLHEQGIYNTERLLEMTALHLDAAGVGETNVWRELALCFLRVSLQEEDQMSACLYISGNDRETQRQRRSACYSRVPGFLINGVSGESWKVRCRWWRNLHFSKKLLASDIAEGDLHRLAYKAACVAHMYGKEARYVAEAYSSN
ncbi:hypothetical protein LINGRAHAP2_LOCUS16129 [Linum grandiflorum]